MKTEKEGLVPDEGNCICSSDQAYPLTYPQRGVWFLEKINPDTGIGNLAATLKVDRLLDRELMNQACNALVRFNEGFRIRIKENEDGQAYQYFVPYEPFEIDYFDFSQAGPEALYRWDREESRRPFSHFEQNLFYFALIKIDEQTSGIFARIHHLIADAWSFVQISGNDLLYYYHLLEQGLPIEEENSPSYRDFIISEQQYIGSDRYRIDREFWLSQFATPPTLTTMKVRTDERIGLKARRRSFQLPEKLSRKIRDYCQLNRASIFSLFFAAMCLYLNRLKDQEDITIGTPVLNRSNSREKKMIGMFISTVPMRVRVDGRQSFAEFSKSLDQAWFAVLKHQKYPYDCLLHDVRSMHPSIEKLYEIAISYQNARFDKQESRINREARWHFPEYQTESLFLHINDREGDSNILLNYDYLEELFHQQEIDFMNDHIVRLLWHALDNPARQISQIHMLSEKERLKVVDLFNQTDAEYPRTETLASLFQTQVQNQPDAVAVTFDNETVTYGMLDQLAEAVAARLRNSKVGRESLVALMLRPSIAMIAAIFGTIKAGAAYLPLDPDYPAERIELLLADSNARILLAETDSNRRIKYSGEVLDVPAVVANARAALEKGHCFSHSPLVNQPGDLLYVIYTSGSTGNPKGVMIEHRNVVRLLFNEHNLFDFSAEDVWTMFHSYCFDFSVWEMYGALLTGGRLVLVPREIARDTSEFRRLLAEQRVTILNQTPAAFYNLIDHEIQKEKHDLSLRMVIFGGDALKAPLLRPFRKYYPTARLINMYGITETTVHVTAIDLSDEDLQSHVANIGRPIPTMRVYILDKHLNPMPIGAPGEICVSGEGVGRGYLNNPDLTAARFISNPFVPGETLYRSGDLGRFFPRGDIEYLGRIDHQVKIRGHRIELGEVESAILKTGKIREVRVLSRDGAHGNKQLIAYFVPAEPVDHEEIRKQLAKILPEYMIPAYLVSIDQLPLNSNGKIAVEALPDPHHHLSLRQSYAAPQNARQEQIIRAFSQVLELPEVGIHDNFFRLGGDSLGAAQVIALLGESVTFADLFVHPTAAELAEHLSSQKEEASPSYLLTLTRGTCVHPVIAFPYAGGTAATFLELASCMESQCPQVGLIAVDWKGDRPGLPRMAELLAEQIQRDYPGPVSLYSHCAGSGLAVATARQLEALGHPVHHLLVGASVPPLLPHRSQKFPARELTRLFRPLIHTLFYNPWRFLSDQSVLNILNRLGLSIRDDTVLCDLSLIKNFRQDVKDYFDYFTKVALDQDELLLTERLKAPIHCILGSEDPITSGATAKFLRWQIFSTAVDLTVLPNAGHYFLYGQAVQLAGWIHSAIKAEQEA